MNAPATHHSFWQRRVRDPLIALFVQGLTADKVALTLGVGAACACLPFLGFTSLLTFGAGLWLRLNQPLLQTFNQLLGPVQLLLIVIYVRLGEWLWQARDGCFTLVEMLRVLREASFRDFLRAFGWAGIHAFTAWVLTAPALIAVVYFSVRPALRRLASKTSGGA